MENRVLANAEKKLQSIRRRRKWQKLAVILGSVVVAGTITALVLPVFTMETKTTCGLEEHIHTAECYEDRILICKEEAVKPQDAHVHTDECYQEQETLVCGREEAEAHTHGEGCYTEETDLTCGREESEGHTHGESCFDEEGNVVCGLEESEGHVHSEDCYTINNVLSCGLPEGEGHTHGPECSKKEKVAVCGQEEAENQTKGHEHNCRVLRSSRPTQADLHPGDRRGAHPTKECYECRGELFLICEKEEHRHNEKCYEKKEDGSDPKADLETREVWESTLQGVKLTGQWNQDILAVAESQLNYKESTRNFVKEGDRVMGYSRYGQWYGIPYGDWCAMFVSFCLNYAGIQEENIPYAAGTITWIDLLKERKMYVPAEGYTPKPGDIVFFDWEQDNESDHVGIVHSLKQVEKDGQTYTEMQTIEGNSSDQVQYVKYTLGEPCIFGFGILPENPENKKGNVYRYEDDVVLVEVTLPKDSEVPADARLSVTPIARDSDEFAAMAAAAQAQAGETVIRPVAYDISFYTDDAYMPVSDSAVVSMKFKDGSMQVGNGSELKILHYSEGQTGEPTAISDVGTTTDETGQEAITFETAGFSPFMFYTAAQAEEVLIPVYTINHFSWTAYQYSSPYPAVEDQGSYLFNKTTSDTAKGWTAVIVEKKSNNRYAVKEVITDNRDKGPIAIPSGGFKLIIYRLHSDIPVGAPVTVTQGTGTPPLTSFTAQSYSKDVVRAIVHINPEDNSPKPKDKAPNDITPFKGADTNDLIKINLYDYGTSVNNRFSSNKQYPGFQQSNGTGTNLGDSIRADMGIPQSLWSVSSVASFGSEGEFAAEPAGRLTSINNLVKITNLGLVADWPLYGVLSPDLGPDGDPVIKNGNLSLGYLFSQSSADSVTKINRSNLNYLFQYDADSGVYYYDSRDNHAQYNSADDSFDLYHQVYSPNAIMYPFGNFMPLNDIVKDSTRSTEIDSKWFKMISSSAQYIYEQGGHKQYSVLAADAANLANGGKTMVQLSQDYFKSLKQRTTAIDGSPMTVTEADLQNVYTGDFDVPSDFFFGMDMEMSFIQPQDGLTGPDGNQDMLFRFAGDDDVMVYVDGRLFLDLSGIHRHVGGDIDFKSGVVHYYSFGDWHGQVDPVPYKTVPFSELVADPSVLNSNGTFSDFSRHTLKFFYMERGSGSGICSIRFNFPLLQENAITVSKALNVMGQPDTKLLGNPDFKFQIMKALGTNPDTDRTENVLIDRGEQFDILDRAGRVVGQGKTGENGIFTLKAGQTAVFNTNIVSGYFYVRELLDPNAFQQYGEITVSGEAVLKDNHNVTLGTQTFTGLDGPILDIFKGNTDFKFVNSVDPKKFSALEITKELKAYGQNGDGLLFDMEVLLDGQKLPYNTPYTVNGETRYTEREGIITLAHGETARLDNLVAGTSFTVTESEESSNGYMTSYEVSYQQTPKKNSESRTGAAGVIYTADTAHVKVLNDEQGISLDLGLQKRLIGYDGREHQYRFLVEEIDKAGNTVAGGYTDEGQMLFPADPAVFGAQERMGELKMSLIFREREMTHLGMGESEVRYYRLREQLNENEPTTIHDTSVYLLEVFLTRDADGKLAGKIDKIYKNDFDTVYDGDALAFENRLTGSLTLRKEVTGSEGEGEGKEFQFLIRLTQGGTPITGQWICTLDGAETALTFSETGEAGVGLKAGQSLTLSELPVGVSWTVREINYGGYTPTVTVRDDTAVSGDEASGQILLGGDAPVVTVTNRPGVLLPATGGSGLWLYQGAGLALLLAAVLFFTVAKRKKRFN